MTMFSFVMVSILLVVVVSVKCQNIRQRFERRLYIFIKERKTFSEIEKLCKSNTAIIASARTPEENTFLFGMRRRAMMGDKRIWIGGDDRNRKDGDYIWSDGSPLNYTNWFNNEPINAGGKEHCMVMEAEFVSMEGKWNDISCEEFRHSAICMKDLATTIYKIPNAIIG